VYPSVAQLVPRRRLRRAVHAVNLPTGTPRPERLTDLIGRRCDGIVTAGLAPHEARPPPPATNTAAERALRPLKVQQKISGSVRSEAGARNHAVLRTPPEELVEQLVTRLPA